MQRGDGGEWITDLAAGGYWSEIAWDLTPEQRESVLAETRWTADRVFTEPSGPPAWRRLPSHYVLATDDQTLPTRDPGAVRGADGRRAHAAARQPLHAARALGAGGRDHRRRRPDGGDAGERDRPPSARAVGVVRRRRPGAEGGRRRRLRRSQRGEVLGRRRRVRVRQVGDGDEPDRPQPRARDDDRGRRALRRPQPRRRLERGAAPDPRQGHRDGLPGRAGRAQPAPARRRPDRRDDPRAPRPSRAPTPGRGPRSCSPTSASRARARHRTATRTSSPAACGSGS